jgi:peptidylprolyl isomerase domain and WD repeat-containing protein 1
MFILSHAGVQHLYDSAIIHTALGDIHVKLFAKECPRSVENFCVHSKNGYYNGHLFHRVIKGFMVQTGDPTGMICIQYLPRTTVGFLCI